MATPRKRPSVKNKKTARPASRQVVSTPDQGAASPMEKNADRIAGAPSGNDALFPSVPDMPEPPKAHIPFADEATPADGAPADFFDLGDGEASSPAASSRASRSAARRSMRARAGARPARDEAARGRVDGARADGVEAARGQSAAGRSRGASAERAASRSTGVRKIVLSVIATAVFAAIAVGAFFVWNTYLRYDDAADIQGEWRTPDGSMTVVIDGTDIRMPNLSYSYEIDTGAKRLTFHFSDLTGSGSYAFSDDRTQLTIVEGEGESATTTVLVKVSDDASATPQLLEPGSADASGDAAKADESESDDKTDSANDAETDAGADASGEADDGASDAEDA